MSKALEAAVKAAHAACDASYVSGLYEDGEATIDGVVNLPTMIQAAISAYLAHLAEDEELTQRLAEVIADAMNMNRAGRLEHKAALAVLKTLAGKE